MALIKIDNDLYDIARRVTEIDSEYYIMYNTSKHRFEVHHSGQGNNTLAAVLPFDRLDARAIAYLRMTRRERAEELMRETEAQNERNKLSAYKQTKQEAEYKLKDYINYATNKQSDIDFAALN